MNSQYSRDHCKLAVGKILQTIGWHSINSTPLEVLTDIMSNYIHEISKISMDYANEFGNTEANLDHLGLAFQEMGINLSELEEYVTYVNFSPPPNPVPKFPIPKENNLNFLKPGSKEVVTRPVHIHEHLPPMHPLLEENKNLEDVKVKPEIVEESTVEVTGNQHFKRPVDLSPEFRKPKKEDEGGRPTREISSVMMTTSGFLSPAREGKLPEAKAPAPPPPPDPPNEPLPSTIDNTVKKKEKRKDKVGKELFKAISEDKILKKIPTMKDFVKQKQKVASNISSPIFAKTSSEAMNSIPHIIQPGTILSPTLQQPVAAMPMNDIKLNVPNVQKAIKDKFDKTLAAAKAKTEKLNTTITPIPALPQSVSFQSVEKLFNEPDRKKINIFKKISNVREGKTKKDSRANTPNVMIEEDIVNKIALSRDITIEPINPVSMAKQDKFDYFDESAIHPLGLHIPPDMLNQGMTIPKQKRKRKEVRKVKKPKKNHNYMGADIIDLAMMENHKASDPLMSLTGRHHQSAHMGLPTMPPNHLPFPFLANFPGPGLIPPPLSTQLNTPLFPFSHLGTFGKNPYFPPVVQNMPTQVEPVPLISPKIKEPMEIKPVEITPKLSPKLTPSPSMPISNTPNLNLQTPPKVAPPKLLQSPNVGPSSTPLSETFPNTPNITTTSVLPPAHTPIILEQKDIASSAITEVKDKKNKEHKKEKKDKVKKKNKKDKVKEKSEKKKLKELKKDTKEKIKKEKKTKKKEEKEIKDVKDAENPIPKILLKVNSPSPRSETPESIKKLNIKPVIRKDEENLVDEIKRESSPGGLAKISALVTGPPKAKTNLPQVIPPAVEKPSEEIHIPVIQKPPARPKVTPVKPKQQKPKKIEQSFKKVDEHGNTVWICPACGQQDDGRPMIGCDGCDAWYHWVCVGIQVPPDESENWYCKPCLCKKNEDLQSDKKRKRKRKEKKDQ